MDSRLDFYRAFISPYLFYNVIVLGGISDSYIKPIIIFMYKPEKIHKNHLPRLENTTPLFSNLKLLKFQDIYKSTHKSIAAGNFATNKM